MAIKIKASHKGWLHQALNIPEGEPIPLASLTKAMNSDDPHMRKMANFAKNAKGFKRGFTPHPKTKP